MRRPVRGAPGPAPARLPELTMMTRLARPAAVTAVITLVSLGTWIPAATPAAHAAAIPPPAHHGTLRVSGAPRDGADGHRYRAALARAPAAARDEPAQLRGRLLLAELRRGRDALPGRGGQHRRAVRRAPLHRRPGGHRPPAAGDRNRLRGRPDPAEPVHLPGHPPLGQRAHRRRGPRLPAAQAAGHRVRQRHPGAAHHLDRGVLPGRRAARQRGRRHRGPAVPDRPRPLAGHAAEPRVLHRHARSPGRTR